MTILRIALALGVVYVLSGCCKPEVQELKQTMYLENIEATSRDVVESDFENSIIDGTTFPMPKNFERNDITNVFYSFSDAWNYSSSFDHPIYSQSYYGKWFFDSIPNKQDLFLTWDLALDRDLSDLFSLAVSIDVCGESVLPEGYPYSIDGLALYKNPSPLVSDNLVHMNLSLPIPVLIEIGLISNVNVSKDICIYVVGDSLKTKDLCSKGNIVQFNTLRTSGSKISQVLNDLEAQGITFDYPSNDSK